MKNRTFAPVLVLHPVPHFDDLVRAVMIFVLALHSFDLFGDRTGTSVDIQTHSANKITKKQRGVLERLRKWIFVGVFGGGHDEHDKKNPALAAATMVFEGMTNDELRVRFMQVMHGYGVPAAELRTFWERFEVFRFYAGHKDNYASAHRLGVSWAFKQIGLMLCSGDAHGKKLSADDLRSQIYWVNEVMMCAIGVTHDEAPGVDPRVEETVIRWICGNRDILWPQQYEAGMTLTSIIKSIKKHSGRSASWLVNRLKQLRGIIYGMNNSATDYCDVDDWMVEWHLATHPEHKMPEEVGYSKGMTIEEVVAKLKGLDPKTAFRSELLQGMSNLLDNRDKEITDRSDNGGDPRMDERDPRCPFSFHETVRRFCQRDAGNVSCDKLKSKGLAARYVNMTLSTWWKYCQEEEKSRRESCDAERFPIIIGGEEVGYMDAISSANATAAIGRLKGGADAVANKHPVRLGIYVAMNQKKYDMKTIDSLIRVQAESYRILQYRMDGILLPANLDDLRADGTLLDGKLHVGCDGNGNAYAVINGTDHHPEIVPTDIPFEVVTTIAWVILTVSYRPGLINQVLPMLRGILVNTGLDQMTARLLKIREVLENMGSAAA
ncbi:hypothetical protein HQ524_04850 [Candidatus Uhrbacteria bacterium]|nr:hypothetical protein [Candidatus Uhrbacteria bacterium]